MIIRFWYDSHQTGGVFHADYYQDKEEDYRSGPFLQQESDDCIQFLALVVGALNVKREPAQDFYGEDFPAGEREALVLIFAVYNRHVFCWGEEKLSSSVGRRRAFR
ncbi:MAG: hypothetical protein HYV65_03030 [Candidatus Spechtbacteria bacterium]|nr:hypothetical protein [Candidatus Spechtbacteria bacterium]